jgi:hypothetical protein
MGLIHSNDCHCHCNKGEHCVPDVSPDATPSWLPDVTDFSKFTVDCGPMQPVFDKVAKYHKEDKSLDWFEPFENFCTVTDTGDEPLIDTPQDATQGSRRGQRGG